MFAVTAKIRSLYDCQLRLMHNIQPLPSGTDIANTVKYFSQTLLSKCNKACCISRIEIITEIILYTNKIIKKYCITNSLQRSYKKTQYII